MHWHRTLAWVPYVDYIFGPWYQSLAFRSAYISFTVLAPTLVLRLTMVFDSGTLYLLAQSFVDIINALSDWDANNSSVLRYGRRGPKDNIFPCDKETRFGFDCRFLSWLIWWNFAFHLVSGASIYNMVLFFLKAKVLWLLLTYRRRNIDCLLPSVTSKYYSDLLLKCSRLTPTQNKKRK